MKTVIAFLILGALHLAAQDMQSCPMHKEHMKEAAQRQADVEKHGDEAMGFPHDKTTHHFRLYSDGGAIEVTVNDNKDSQNLQAIRSHLAHIVTMFSNGEFSIPMFVHDQVPPGVSAMASAPATTATRPSMLFHAIVKYSNCFPRRATACRSSAISITRAYQEA